MDREQVGLRRSYWKIIYSVLAVAAFVGLFFLTFQDRTQRMQKEEFSVVILGDSIPAVCRDETSIAAQLSEYLDRPVFNGALGGTCMSRMDLDNRLSYTKDSLSIAGLAKAIAAQDFGVQQATRIRESATDYFADTIDEMETINFGTVDILLIETGVNDYHGGARLYPSENPYDEYTFLGALRSSVTGLQKAYPDMRIILVTPTYSWYTVTELTCEELNQGYGIMEDFVNAELQAAKELGVESIDLYHDFYPHEKWEDWEVYTFDGLHPNEEGRTLIARKIADYLLQEEG